MRLELYLAETARLAKQLSAILDDTAIRLQQHEQLNLLEQNGVLHTLQLLTENAIGKAKHLLKASDYPVPVSAYDAIHDLARLKKWQQEEISQWHSIIGLRNRIVHEYMNIDIQRVLDIVKNRQYRIITEFLLQDTP